MTDLKKDSNILGMLCELRDGKALRVADHFLSTSAMAACVCGSENAKARAKFSITITLRAAAAGGGNSVKLGYVIRHESPTNTGVKAESTVGEEVLTVSANGVIRRAQNANLDLFPGLDEERSELKGVHHE